MKYLAEKEIVQHLIFLLKKMKVDFQKVNGDKKIATFFGVGDILLSSLMGLLNLVNKLEKQLFFGSYNVMIECLKRFIQQKLNLISFSEKMIIFSKMGFTISISNEMVRNLQNVKISSKSIILNSIERIICSRDTQRF